MKKIFLLFALVAFVGTATITPVLASENAIVFCEKCGDKDKKCGDKDKKSCAKGKKGKKGCCAAKAKGNDTKATAPVKAEEEKVDEVK